MADWKTPLAELEAICRNPGEQLRRLLRQGREAVGVLPYFCPEELVYAAGLIPFGLWGGELEAVESRRYFPAFICSLLHTTLELGLRGELDGLRAIMIPISCDSLKGMSANWEYGVPQVPVLPVAYAQNRKLAAGVDFTLSQLRKLKGQLETLGGSPISGDAIAAAVAVFNENRKAQLAFCAAAARQPALVSPYARCCALKAGYFMDRAEHTRLLRSLCAELEAEPEAPWKGLRLVTTGILADSPALLQMLTDNRISIVADQVAQESVGTRSLTPVTADPLLGMAQRLGQIEGCSVLYDPGKERGRELVRLVQEFNADGVLWVMTKFCDPEEYDFVPVKRMLEQAGIPLLSIEVDQQSRSLEQARSALEAFADTLS